MIAKFSNTVKSLSKPCRRQRLELDIRADHWITAMSVKRRVEVFSAGCAFCNEVVEAVRRETDPSCEVKVVSTLDSRVLARAEELDIQSVPAIVIDGKLAGSCSANGVVELLKSAGVGKG